MGELKGLTEARKLRIEAFEHERPVDDGERRHGEGGDRGDQDQRGIVKREHRAEQDVQEVDAAAFHRHDQHAERERDEIEGGEARVLAQDGRAGDETGEQNHGDTSDKAAKAHGRHREAGDEEADRRAWQDGVAHGVAHQAQAAEHEEYADRRRAEREGKAADQRPSHEGEFDEGIDEGMDHAEIRSVPASPRSQISACSSHASVSCRDLTRFFAVSTCLVGPQATTSRASSSVLGKCSRT